MDDLVKQLRDVAEATGPNHARQIALDAADCIEALEARVAAADKLAEVLRNTQLYLGDHAIPNALAAYQATKEGE
jgi:hypothetical protein